MGEKTENKWLAALLPMSPYEEIWELQKEIVEAKVQRAFNSEVVLILEHEPVFTLGRRGNRANVLISEQWLKRNGIKVIRVERGGDVTYHGPGQLIAYPIVALRRNGLGVVELVERLEEVMIRVARDFGIKACRNPLNRGVWVGDKKLGSVGIAIRHGVSYHGLALNINNSLEPFSWINPCGLKGTMMTSLSAESGHEINMEEAREYLRRHMEEVFGVRLRSLDLEGLKTELAKAEQRKPEWLKIRLADSPVFGKTRGLLSGSKLHTVCEEALCPNRWRCYSQGTATFLILGDMCTRNCRFCAVQHGRPAPPDPDEPRRVAEVAVAMELDHVVITSVTRDDLPDGGSGHFAQVVAEIRRRLPHCTVELLIPDFGGNPSALDKVLASGPDVLNHNLETVPRLYSRVRPGASYMRSLELLARAKARGMVVKSGLMLGLGERKEEVEEVLSDLCKAGCDLLTLGQYLQPSPMHLKVDRYITPEEFKIWEKKALDMGFKGVSSGPLVRSSYRAKELLVEIRRKASFPTKMLLLK